MDYFKTIIKDIMSSPTECGFCKLLVCLLLFTNYDFLFAFRYAKKSPII